MARLARPLDSSRPPERDGDYDLIPVGWYQAEIDNADIEDFRTDRGQGDRAKIVLKISGPTHEGRLLWDRIILSHTGSQQAAEIGVEKLRALAYHAGVPQLTDTDQLIGRRLEVRVGVQAARGDYAAKNEVKAYRALGGGVQNHGGRAERVGNASNQQVPRRAGPPQRMTQADVRPPARVQPDAAPPFDDDNIPF